MKHTTALDDISITGPYSPGISIGHDPFSAYPTASIDPFDTHGVVASVTGQMLTEQIIISNLEVAQMNMDETSFKQEMKKRLCMALAEKMLENKLVEFTKQENLQSGEVTFRARAYLTPDSQVRLLRKGSV
jgi:hypothetical protein